MPLGFIRLITSRSADPAISNECLQVAVQVQACCVCHDSIEHSMLNYTDTVNSAMAICLFNSEKLNLKRFVIVKKSNCFMIKNDELISVLSVGSLGCENYRIGLSDPHVLYLRWIRVDIPYIV